MRGLDLPRFPARRALRTAMLLASMLRAGGGTATTLMSGGTRHRVSGSSIGCSRDCGMFFNPYSCNQSATDSTKSGISIVI